MLPIALGADHAGFALKEILRSWLEAQGHQVLDVGTHTVDSVDYPDFAEALTAALLAGVAERGILVCGTGIGMAMAANNAPGVRAAACADAYTARMAREHNDANVLALGARLLRAEDAIEIVRVWLDTAFAGDRHVRRLAKLAALERREPHVSAR
jgi:ribose 5-phosphate isomerase B